MSEDSNLSADDTADKPAGVMKADQIVDERGVPLTNVLKEMTRKVGRLSDISAKLDLLLQNQTADNASGQGRFKAPEAPLESEVKRYIDARFLEDKKASIDKAQQESIERVFAAFPELNPDSASHDEQFYKLAVEYEKKIDPMDPARSLNAAKLAALDLGRVEQLTKNKLLQDESRRTRYIEEGGSPKKETKAQAKTMSSEQAKNLKRHFNIDPKKVEQFTKNRG